MEKQGGDHKKNYQKDNQQDLNHIEEHMKVQKGDDYDEEEP